MDRGISLESRKWVYGYYIPVVHGGDDPVILSEPYIGKDGKYHGLLWTPIVMGSQCRMLGGLSGAGLRNLFEKDIIEAKVKNPHSAYNGQEVIGAIYWDEAAYGAKVAITVKEKPTYHAIETLDHLTNIEVIGDPLDEVSEEVRQHIEWAMVRGHIMPPKDQITTTN